jgi:hypothetical protein
MVRRTFFQHALRGILVGLVTLGPLVSPPPFPFIPAVAGALLAYDGTDRRTLALVCSFLIIVELAGGIHLGMLSLSFLGTALLLSLAGRVFAVPPWAGADGWHPADMLRAMLVATLLALAMMAGSILIGATVYGLGSPLVRLAVMLTPNTVGTLAAVAAAMLVALRRIDVPFRRAIRFGT